MSRFYGSLCIQYIFVCLFFVLWQINSLSLLVMPLPERRLKVMVIGADGQSVYDYVLMDGVMTVATASVSE